MFRKVDLHVHTPASSCYEEHVNPEMGLQTTPEDIVAGALAAGMEAVAITDHNSAEGIDAIRDVVLERSLYVFPGLELSVRGGHILAIFELDTPVEKLRRLLDDLGFSEEHRGNGFLSISLWMDEVVRSIAENGGLAIAAHADRYPRGLLASEEASPDKKRIYESPYLSALEITNAADRLLWSEGRAPGYPKKYPCIQGSDAHSPGEIGRRWTCLEMPSVTLAGLRLALSEYISSIRLSGEGEIERCVSPPSPGKKAG